MKLNKIYNVDSYEAIKNIPDNTIDLIYTDIPYKITSGGKSLSSLGKRIDNVKNNIKDISNGIDYEIFKQFIRVQQNINIFIWCSKLQIPDILNWFLKYDVNYEILVWTKNNPTPATKNIWLPDIEYCLYFRSNGVLLNDGYFLKSKWFNSSINKSDKDLYEHPTIKPLNIVKRHIEHATKHGAVVLDPFIGSGTTAEACKLLDRNYIGFEIRKDYYNIAIDRLNGITKNERELKKLGQISMFD